MDNLAVGHDLLSDTWTIIRWAGVTGKRLQYYKLGMPAHINAWIDQTQVGSRDAVLAAFTRLALNPYFARIR